VRQAQNEDTQDGRDILLNVALAWLRLAHQRQAPEALAMPAADRAQSEAVADAH
jgi:hypothetical protein